MYIAVMIANHIHDALGQVRRLQELVLDKHMFRGYSGKARLACGAMTLLAAAAMSSRWMPSSPAAHLAGWCSLLAAALIANYGALALWFLFDRDVQRDWHRLKPAVDALPALAGGAVMTVALAAGGQYDYLFGTWMVFYGLAQTAYRKSLPPGIYGVGLCYLACGTMLLLCRCIPFTQPWPMALVFILGETAGGLLLHRQQRNDT